MLNYIQIQSLANKITEFSYEDYETHRRKTMKRIVEALNYNQEPKSALIVGVGNANDLDIDTLLNFVSKLWLVDVDRQVMEKTINKYELGDQVDWLIADAGGTVKWIDQFCYDVIKTPHLFCKRLKQLKQNLRSNLLDFKTPIPFKVDLVISQCVLSQIIWPVTQMVWDQSGIPWDMGQNNLVSMAFTEPYVELRHIINLIILSHLKWLTAMLNPEGILLINSDTTWQGISIYGIDSLQKIIQANDFEHGLDLELLSSQTWLWRLDDITETNVKSYIYRSL